MRRETIVTSPPRAETRAIRGGVPALNTITSPLPQLAAPRDAAASVIVWTEPSAMSIRFTFPSAKNPIQRLSGDQNGIIAFSVPASGRDVNESSRRTQSCVRSGFCVATNASCVPSGEIAPPLVPSSRPIPLLEPKKPSAGGSI